MHSVIKKGLSNPYLFYKYGLNRMGHLFNYGITPFEREWDILIIIDACRYGLFKEAVTGSGY